MAETATEPQTILPAIFQEWARGNREGANLIKQCWKCFLLIKSVINLYDFHCGHVHVYTLSHCTEPSSGGPISTLHQPLLNR